MSRAADELKKQVSQRARDHCEYCGMHQSLQGSTFHLEHIIAKANGGATAVENLAWACPKCNFHKSDRVDVVDPLSGAHVRLFNPRRDFWPDHFRWDGYRVVAHTAIGRATIVTLDLNSERRCFIRQAEEIVDLFPPKFLSETDS